MRSRPLSSSLKVSRRQPGLGDRDSTGAPRKLRPGLARRSLLAGRIAWARLRPISERLEWQRAQSGASASPHDADYFAQPAVTRSFGRPFHRREKALRRASGRKPLPASYGAWRILL